MGTGNIRRLTGLWPYRAGALTVLGAGGGILLFLVELLHWSTGPVAPGFLSTAGTLLILEGMALGAVLAVGGYPSDRAADRPSYLLVLGVAPARHVAASMLRTAWELIIAVGCLCASALALAWLLLPRQLSYPDRLSVSALRDLPWLADIAATAWCLGAALTVAAVVHLLSITGLNRLLAASLAALSPFVVGLGLDRVGLPEALNLFEPPLWVLDNPFPFPAAVSGPLTLLTVFVVVAASSMAAVRVLPDQALFSR